MICTRTAVTQDTEFQTRAEDGNLYIEGYFALFGSKYWLWDEAYETIEPGAFDLDRDTDIRALTNHDTTLVLGRTTVGTLSLRIDERGLWGAVTVNQNDQDAVNAYERVRRGDVSQCSFGFDILAQDVEQREDGLTVWHLRSIKLYEVSVVTFPAYQDTGVTARKAELAEIRKRENEKWRADMLAKLKGERTNGSEDSDAQKEH